MKTDDLSGRFFLDTNIIIYSFDSSSPKKKKRASELIAHGLSTGLGIISHQVIQEFASVACDKFKRAFEPAKLILYLDEVLFGLWKAYPSREAYIAAIEIRRHYGLSWWDSLIVSSALETSCAYILSEDLQHDQRIETVRIINPFD